MIESLKRSSGQTELEVVVRGYNPYTNTMDYATLDHHGKVMWKDGKDMGVGATREAQIIFDSIQANENELERLEALHKKGRTCMCGRWLTL